MRHSGLGKELQGAPSCNGWTFWHYEDGDEVKPIDAVRQVYRLAVEDGGNGLSSRQALCRCALYLLRSLCELSIGRPLTFRSATGEIMKHILPIAVLLAPAVAYAHDETEQVAPPELVGPYLGQEPPGTTPEPFAPGIVTTEEWEYGGVFSPSMNEFYVFKDDEDEKTWQHVYRNQDGQWRESVLWPRQGTPTISPDGKTMYLGRRYKLRTEVGWSETRSLGEAFEDIRIMRLTASAEGTFYFDEAGSDGDGQIRYSRLVNGEREAPRLASDEINVGTWLAHPFIAPDESYLLFDGRREGGFGGSDIYVSFRQDDGSWGVAINLGNKINTASWDAAASVTPDGRYMFFHRDVGEGNVDIFWVDAQVIEDARRGE